MAKTVKLQELNRQYEFVCNEWVRKFCNKQQIDFDGWVGDEVGSIASFACQYFFNLEHGVRQVFHEAKLIYQKTNQCHTKL